MNHAPRWELSPGISVGGGAAGPGVSVGARVKCRLKHWEYSISNDGTLWRTLPQGAKERLPRLFIFIFDNLKEISLHVPVIYFPHSHIKFIHEDGISIASC